MGLFTKKDPCAICGGKVKGLLSWKIEGKYICDDCYGVVDVQERTSDWTLEEFQQYRAFRESCQPLRDQFQITDEIDLGFFNKKLYFDTVHHLMTFDRSLRGTIFEGKNIRSFRITEDSAPLFEGTAAGVTSHESAIPQRVHDMLPLINQYRMNLEMRRTMENLNEALGKEQNNPIKEIRLPKPVDKFFVEIKFDHPYWNEFKADRTIADFDRDDPNPEEYLRRYHDDAQLMANLSRCLAAVVCPGKPEKVVSASGKTASASASDPVAEIQRFKELLDQGILTEEEFAAKKRQLLGL